MTTANLTPVSVFDAAEARLFAAAEEMLALVGVTLHRQYPDGAFLVLTRPTDYDAVRLDSAREDQGEILREFEELPEDDEPLPAVPEEIAAVFDRVNESHSGSEIESHVAPSVVGMEATQVHDRRRD
ncbi:hypothetical protein [Streptomyces sp. NPDC059455]|uniref:hypothetical protein n=1 Tax=Streptomyces sp. NPDC059455 TaxID=3346837 RepID=UPI0036C5DEF0